MVRPTGSSDPRGGREGAPDNNEPRRHGQGRAGILCATNHPGGAGLRSCPRRKPQARLRHRPQPPPRKHFSIPCRARFRWRPKGRANRLDAAAIQQAYMPAPSGRFPLKYANQTCLADATNAMQEDDERSCGIEQRGKPRQLALPPAETFSVRALKTVLDGAHTASQSIETQRVIDDFDFSSRSHPSLMLAGPTRPKLTV